MLILEKLFVYAFINDGVVSKVPVIGRPYMDAPVKAV